MTIAVWSGLWIQRNAIAVKILSYLSNRKCPWVCLLTHSSLLTRLSHTSTCEWPWPQEQGSSLNHLTHARFSVTSSLFSAINSSIFLNLPRAHPIHSHCAFGISLLTAVVGGEVLVLLYECILRLSFPMNGKFLLDRVHRLPSSFLRVTQQEYR